MNAYGGHLSNLARGMGQKELLEKHSFSAFSQKNFVENTEKVPLLNLDPQQKTTLTLKRHGQKERLYNQWRRKKIYTSPLLAHIDLKKQFSFLSIAFKKVHFGAKKSLPRKLGGVP